MEWGDFSKEMQKQTLAVVDGITQVTSILYYHILSHYQKYLFQFPRFEAAKGELAADLKP